MVEGLWLRVWAEWRTLKADLRTVGSYLGCSLRVRVWAYGFRL